MKISKISVIIFFFVAICFIAVENIKINIDKESIYTTKIPQDMKVAHYANNSTKDLYRNIYIDRQKVPEVKNNEVLVYVKTASFSQKDFEFYKNNQNKNIKSFIPCSDFSGVIVKVGKDVKKFEIGDKVFGIADIKKGNGACAEYVAVQQNNIGIIPYSLTYKQAASIPTPALLNWLAYHNLDRKGFKTGKVLVDDPLSETGIMLTGLLIRNGFEVDAIDNKDVRNWAYGFGIKNFIDIDEIEKFEKLLAGKYDVVFNLRHGVDEKKLLSFVKKGGEFISLENINLTRQDIKIKVINLDKVDNAMFAKMARLVHLGKLDIKVAREFNLDQIKDAYMRAEKGNLDGKVIVNVHNK